MHLDEIPMPIPDGAATPFAWTLQPAGATFDPPVQIQLPNMAGLPPGAVAYLLSFDHATEAFEIVATGSVTADGACIVSDPGDGIATSGWGGACPPYPPPTEAKNCAGTDLWSIAKSGLKLIAQTIAIFADIDDKIKCALDAVNAVDAAFTAWETVKTDGTLEQAELDSVLAAVNMSKAAIVNCVAAFAFDPAGQAANIQKFVNLLNAAIQTAQDFNDCYSPGLQVALGAANTLTSFVSKMIGLATAVDIKQQALNLACSKIELLINTIITLPGANAGGDPIAEIDALFAEIQQAMADSAAQDPAIQAVLADQPQLEAAEADLDDILQNLETNPELAGCKITVGGQTAVANEGGGFLTTNIPNGLGLAKVSVVCDQLDPPLYGETTYFDLINGGALVVQDLVALSPTPPPTVASIAATAAMPVLTSVGAQTQMTVLAELSDGSPLDVTPRMLGTTYSSSNAAVATVDQDGLVTAQGDGTALIAATNEGATSVTGVIVTLGDPLTTVEGFVVDDQGDPVSGADVNVGLTAASTTSDAAGFFSIPDQPSQLGPIQVSAIQSAAGMELAGVSPDLEPEPGGVTDAGLVVISDAVFWATDSSGSWETGSNWSTGSVPADGARVVIDRPAANVTVTASAAHLVDQLICTENLTVQFGGDLEVGTLADLRGVLRIGPNGVVRGGPVQVAAVVELAGGRIEDAEVVSGGPAGRIDVLNSSSVQDSRLAVDVDVQSGRNLSATGTLTVDGTLSLFSRGFGQGGNTLLQFQGDGVIEGSGTVAHGTNQLNNHIQTTSGTLTIGPDVTVRGFGGTLGTATTSFVNHGRIEAQSSNNFFRVMGDGWTNLGTIEADGGRLRLDGTWSNEGVIRAVGNDAELMGTWDSTGSLAATAGGELDLKGTWSHAGPFDMTGATLLLGGSFGSGALDQLVTSGGTVKFTGTMTGSGFHMGSSGTKWELSGGTIQGGTITGVSGTQVDVVANSTVGDVTLERPVRVPAGRTLNATGTVTVNSSVHLDSSFTPARMEFQGGGFLMGTGDVFFNNAPGDEIACNGGTLTTGPDLTISGHIGFLGTDGAGLVNQAHVRVDNFGTINIRGADWTNLGTFEFNGGDFDLGGTFTTAAMGTFVNNGGITLRGVLDNTGDVLDVGIGNDWESRGGTVIGGLVQSTDGSGLLMLTTGFVDGATFDANVSIAQNATMTVLSDATFNGTISMQANAFNSSTLFTQGDVTLSGTGQLSMGSSALSTVVPVGGTLTLGPGFTVRGAAATVGTTGLALVNQGTLRSEGILTVLGDFENQGLVDGPGGAGFTFADAFVQTAGTTGLDGGSFASATGFDVQGGLVSGTGTLDGALVSAGTLRSTGTLGVTGAFENQGLVENPGGTALDFMAPFLQTAGTTDLDGGLLTAALGFDFQAGELRGTGTLTGDVQNAGTLRPGASAGALTVDGNYLQLGAGTLAIELGGLLAGAEHDLSLIHI